VAERDVEDGRVEKVDDVKGTVDVVATGTTTPFEVDEATSVEAPLSEVV